MIQFVLEKRGANPMGNVAMLYFFLLATVQHLFLATMLLLSAPWFITALVFYWSLIYRREDKYPGSTPDIDLAFHYRISETGNQKSNRNRVPAGHTKFTLFDSQSTGGDTRGGFSWPNTLFWGPGTVLMALDPRYIAIWTSSKLVVSSISGRFRKL